MWVPSLIERELKIGVLEVVAVISISELDTTSFPSLHRIISGLVPTVNLCANELRNNLVYQMHIFSLFQNEIDELHMPSFPLYPFQ